MKKLNIAVAVWFAIFSLIAAQAFAAGEQEHDKMQNQATMQQEDFTNRASKLIGKEVHNDQGETLGTVEDLILSRSGEIDYLILSRADGVFEEAELVPVPWQAVSPRAEEEVIILSMNKETLQNAPSFTEENWPNFSQPAYEQEIQAYFGEDTRIQQQQDLEVTPDQTDEYKTREEMQKESGELERFEKHVGSDPKVRAPERFQGKEEAWQ